MKSLFSAQKGLGLYTGMGRRDTEAVRIRKAGRWLWRRRRQRPGRPAAGRRRPAAQRPASRFPAASVPPGLCTPPRNKLSQNQKRTPPPRGAPDPFWQYDPQPYGQKTGLQTSFRYASCGRRKRTVSSPVCAKPIRVHARRLPVLVFHADNDGDLKSIRQGDIMAFPMGAQSGVHPLRLLHGVQAILIIRLSAHLRIPIPGQAAS